MRREDAMARVTLSEPAPLSPNALVILRERYLRRNERLEVIESPDEMFRRVAHAVAQADARYGPPAAVEAAAEEFYQAMAGLEFLPNSPALMNAGMPLQQLMACFVLPVEDSLAGIFETLKLAALIQQSGGGTGFSFSRLRPRGDVVGSTKGIASGPVSFMAIYDAMSETIKQGSKRRGANMGVLRVDHPDIREFITCKRDRTRFTNFNISVGITDAFMQAVQQDGEYDLINPRTGTLWERARAREIWDLIVENAWDSGEPGLLFLDTVNRTNPTRHLGEIEATNPCGEQPLHPYEACCLGSINVSRLVVPSGDGFTVNWSRLAELVRMGVHFLDNIVDINRYPAPQTQDICTRNRRIGLGVMGWADLLVRLGIPYDTEGALLLAEEVMGFIAEHAIEASVKLAEQRGVFPNYPGSAYDLAGGPRVRNATTRTIAPTGTISMIANCSSGIEPLFAVAYVKRVLGGVELAQEPHPVFRELAEQRGFYSEELMQKVAAHGTIQHLTEIPADVRRLFRTALDIAPEWHIRMQAAFQKYTDNAVSKTINLPQEATLEDVARAYQMAYELGCKGITVYRYGSRPHQVLSVHAYCLSCAGEDGLPLEQPAGAIPAGIVLPEEAELPRPTT
jgi:ribonucleoside-diphosphate reductase alpha chain